MREDAILLESSPLSGGFCVYNIRTRMIDGNRENKNINVEVDRDDVRFYWKQKLIMHVSKSNLFPLSNEKYLELLDTMVDSPYSRYVIRDSSGKPSFIFRIQIIAEMKIIRFDGEFRKEDGRKFSFTTADCALSDSAENIWETFYNSNSTLYMCYS
jgi:hypothetical protein